MATVDRTNEYAEPDPEVIVTLDCGFEIRFFYQGLTDEEYIKRAGMIKILEEIPDDMFKEG